MGMSRKLNQMMVAPLPRCFHRISCAHLPRDDDEAPRRRSRSGALIRLVKSDGVVAIYDRPVTASELMEEFPKHMVCRSDCFYIGQVTPALSHHDRLLPGHNYFLLPANFFQSALSFATFLRCRTSAAGRPPFELEKTPAGALRVKVTEEMIIQRQKEMEAEAELARRIVRVCTTPQLRKDYDLLVARRLHWKPKLDTISEHKARRHRKILRKTKSNVV
ncbi:uncharacterized protein LOC130993160 [Salvia miltiorrhiza]|uniref:uncharacterized protein LOC130993160 n=1 Tax=Salvia miltiorrhiza TaxID=226208 RepID=UPI0025ABAB7C|nr:uncharacterized protein LOC130993160 [Salvia miltiorrhiza]